MRARTLAAALLLLLPCACKVGPNYKRPVLSVPDQYRGAAPPIDTQSSAQPGQPPQPGQEAFGDMKWFAVLQDETLQSLIKEALTNNYNIRIAAARIAEDNA